MKKKAAKHPNGFPFSYHQHFFNQRKGSNNTEMIWNENKEANHVYIQKHIINDMKRFSIE